jgi:hypothetical protein
MNGGHGRGWTDVIPCTGTCAKRSKKEATRITSLVQRAGSDVTGRYILVVDGDRIYRAGCVPMELKDGQWMIDADDDDEEEEEEKEEEEEEDNDDDDDDDDEEDVLLLDIYKDSDFAFEPITTHTCCIDYR